MKKKLKHAGVPSAGLQKVAEFDKKSVAKLISTDSQHILNT
jgi:hypothetical protein